MANHAQPMSKKQLREFGLITGALFGAAFGLLIPWLWNLGWPTWPWYIPAVLWPWALIHPSSLIVIYKPWMRLAEAIGWFNTRVILFILFFMILLPIGFIMRLFGHDPMQLKLDATLGSYRKQRSSRDKHHMERPF